MIEDSIPNFSKYKAVFTVLAGSGWGVVLGITGVTPLAYIATYPDEWLNEYNTNHYAFSDPAFAWSLENRGYRRWSEIDIEDPQDVMKKAKRFGLNFGAAFSISSAQSTERFHAFFCARPDREFENNELVHLMDHFAELVIGFENVSALTASEKQCLFLISRGYSQSQVASKMELSVETVKKRLSSARTALQAENTIHAISIAERRGIFTL